MSHQSNPNFYFTKESKLTFNEGSMDLQKSLRTKFQKEKQKIITQNEDLN